MMFSFVCYQEYCPQCGATLGQSGKGLLTEDCEAYLDDSGVLIEAITGFDLTLTNSDPCVICNNCDTELQVDAYEES